MGTANYHGTGDCAGKPASVLGRLGLSLFFLFFFVMGLLFEVLTLREAGRALGQRAWKKTPCTIVAGEVQERGGGESPYAFSISYRYNYGGNAYSGSVYKRGYSGSSTYSAAQDLVQRYPAGEATVCYVNPANANEAVLKRDSALIGFVALFPLIFVVIGAGGVYFLWRKPSPAKAKPIAPVSTGVKGKSKYVAAAFFALFAVVGGAMLFPLGIKPIARTLDAESWTPTPCKVLRAEVRSHDSDDGTTYSAYILYQYESGGQTYKADRYDFMGGSSSGYEGKARVVAQYQAAANPVCYVNPKRPSEAVLKRGFHAKLLLALFPLPFLLVGVGGLVHTLRGKGRDAAGSAVLAGRVPDRRVDSLSVLRPGDSGSAVLRPRFSAPGKLGGAVVIAAFWNGIVSIFVAGAGLFTLVFLLPFIAIGIGLIGLVAYQFLALFNPRPTLELNPPVIPLGSAAALRWSFTGQVSRITELAVTLQGIEEAKYRKGTSTYTDKNTFCEMELYRTSDLVEIASGQVGLIVPGDTMHSFKADNNRIVWSIEIRGDIKRWPDVKESFEIEVTPTDGRQERHG